MEILSFENKMKKMNTMQVNLMKGILMAIK